MHRRSLPAPERKVKGSKLLGVTVVAAANLAAEKLCRSRLCQEKPRYLPRPNLPLIACRHHQGTDTGESAHLNRLSISVRDGESKSKLQLQAGVPTLRSAKAYTANSNHSATTDLADAWPLEAFPAIVEPKPDRHASFAEVSTCIPLHYLDKSLDLNRSVSLPSFL